MRALLLLVGAVVVHSFLPGRGVVPASGWRGSLGRGREGAVRATQREGGTRRSSLGTGGRGGETSAAAGACVGIDLGTTYCCVGAWKDGRVEIVPNELGHRVTPSFVAWDATGQRLIGDAAKAQASSNPLNTIYDIKRLIGRKFSDEIVQNDMKHLPYKISRKLGDKNDKPVVEVNTSKDKRMKFTPEEISAMILRKLKENAEAYLGEPVNRAVVTVPAYFNDAQRQATKDAGAIAGLTVDRVLNEPTAAALAYGTNTASSKASSNSEEKVLVFDLGGGTFDVTLLSLENGVFEVLATSGDTHLGGEDFDQVLMQHFIKEFEKRYPMASSSFSAKSLARLKKACDEVKRTLSVQSTASLEINSFHENLDLIGTMSKAKFDNLCGELFMKTLKPVKQVISDSNIEKRKIDKVVLVGGSTRIPKIQENLANFFGIEESDLCKSVNADEAVAYGAAVQGAILAGQGKEATKDIILLDVAPLSLGIETAGGIMATLIKKGTTIPARKVKTFSTFQDNQPLVDVQVYEGERPLTKDNRLLGNFELDGIAPLPRGTPKIEVGFDVDANGILQVSAEDRASGKSSQITITANQGGRLSDDEINKMVQEAEKYAEEDQKIRKAIEAKNSLENYLYDSKKALDPTGSSNLKLATKQRETVEKTIEEGFSWLHASSSLQRNENEYTSKRKDLENILSPFFLAAYNSPHASNNATTL